MDVSLHPRVWPTRGARRMCIIVYNAVVQFTITRVSLHVVSSNKDMRG